MMKFWLPWLAGCGMGLFWGMVFYYGFQTSSDTAYLAGFIAYFHIWLEAMRQLND